MAVLDSFLEPILKLEPWIVIIGASLILSILITFVYKWMTDQVLMKQLKDDIKKHQEEMKKTRDNPKKMMEIQKKAMEKNMQYMMKSMKPTLITFLPLILVFGWLSSHYTYEPIMPGQEFTVSATFKPGTTGQATMIPTEGIDVIGNHTQDLKDSSATWTLKVGKEGDYLVQIESDSRKYDKEITVSSMSIYTSPIKTFKEDRLESIELGMKKLRVFGEDFNIFGWHPGWLGVYIITSIIFSMGLRKLMNLY